MDFREDVEGELVVCNWPMILNGAYWLVAAKIANVAARVIKMNLWGIVCLIR